jgi:hypothetical protein
MRKRSSFWFYIPPPVIAGALIAFWQYRTHQSTPEPSVEEPSPPTEQVSRREETQQRPVAPPPTRSETPATPAVPVVDTTPVGTLEEATALFPKLAATVFPKERIAGWLGQSDLLRRIVGVVDCVGNGVSPRGQMEFLAPREPFQGERLSGGRWRAASANSLRTTAMVETFCMAKAETMATAYTRLEPVFDKLYQDLGYPGERFRDALGRACKVLLDTPVPDEEPALTRSGTTYFYADPRLEHLKPAQKHLLRLGVGDAARVQTKIRQLAAALRLDIQ